jgi:PBP1b-binding outer membrane lipoprotein LpoB
MRSPIAAIALVLLLAGCSAAQVASASRSACRANPERCTDRTTPPESRTPGL